MGKQARCQDVGDQNTSGRLPGGRLSRWLMAVLLSVGMTGGSVIAMTGQAAEPAGGEASGHISPPARTISQPLAAGELISQADLDTLAGEVEALVQGKLDLDNRLNVEFGRYEASRLRLEDSKKSIRSETDEILQNNGSRTRLDSLFERHEQLLQDEKKLSEGLAATQEELAASQLKLAGKQRDLERLQASYAAQQRELALRRVQEVARHLERDMSFRETISFKCATSKSLSTCLNEYPLESRIQGWIEEHYQHALSRELSELDVQVQLSPDWYTTRFTREFADATMSLQGAVTADVEVRAQVAPRKMMACSLIGASAELCETHSVSLIVRSNKYGDQVLVNKKPYGSTPLSLMLEPGVYNVEVRYQGLTQKRTLTLDENRHINFVF